MRTLRLLLAAALGLPLLLVLSAQQAPEAVVGWYGGKWQPGIPGIANWYMDRGTFYRAYDEFEVPEGGWTVVGLFSDNALYDFPKVRSASWEIRRDMAPGVAGKVVASGAPRASVLPDPSVTSPPYPAAEASKHFRIQVDHLKVHLPAGRYWVSVSPIGKGQCFLSATRGAQAVGSFAAIPEIGPMDLAGSVRPGAALVHWPDGPRYEPAESLGDAGQAGVARRFSQGVIIAK